ncbi:MAG: hypothetical protein J5637_01420 [Prevotella sp.]|nr:hypothetical protein [Prevotella sp.]
MKFEILKPQSFCLPGKDKALEDGIFPEAGSGTIHDRLFLVADGMGGQGKGDVASASLCRSIPDFLFQNTCSDEPMTADLLQLTLLDAYKRLAQDCPDGGGVMFAMLYFHRQGVMAAHVGNCRVYHYRPKSHTLLYKSRDDFKAATADMTQPIEPTCKNLTNVKYGDYFVLLTKGAHASIGEQQVFDVLNEAINDEAKLRKIMQMMGEAKEDHTVSLVRVSGVMAEAIDEHVDEATQPIPVVVAPTPKPLPQAQPQPAPKPQPKPQPKPAPQPKPKPQTQQPVEKAEPKTAPLTDNVDSEAGQKKGSFPIVPVTALLLVALAVGLYFWSKNQFTSKEEEAEVVETRKDTVKKDTINIMRNENKKAKTNDDLFKLPEAQKTEEQKKPEPEQSRQETATANASSQNAGTDIPATTETAPATPATTPAPQETAPATPQAPATTTTPPADNPAPSSVSPRPVIPDED